MSHYSVSVITPHKPLDHEIENMLAPFDENKTVEPYICASYEEAKKNYYDIIASQMEREHEDEKEWPERKEALLQLKELLDKDDIKGFVSWVNSNQYYRDYEDLDENGNGISTYNPDSKWDEYIIGGRWHSLFEENDSLPLSDIKPEIVYGEKTEMELKKKYHDEYEGYKKVIENGDSWFPKEYFIELYPTFEDYLIINRNFNTYAILTPEGKWLESGKMGALGMRDASPAKQREFANNFYNVLEDIKTKYPEAWLTVVDCHI